MRFKFYVLECQTRDISLLKCFKNMPTNKIVSKMMVKWYKKKKSVRKCQSQGESVGLERDYRGMGSGYFSEFCNKI